MIKKFRNKPVVVEAIQWRPDYETVCEVGEFMGQLTFDPVTCTKLLIKTLEGVMTADESDWIIKGVNGEFYPCKPDIFDKTYEEMK